MTPPLLSAKLFIAISTPFDYLVVFLVHKVESYRYGNVKQALLALNHMCCQVVSLDMPSVELHQDVI